MKPISFDERENRALQSLLMEIKMDAQRRQYYEPFILDIIGKLEVWPEPIMLTEQENRALQSLFFSFEELVKPFPYPYSPLTFAPSTVQVELCYNILQKLKWAAQ